MNTPGAVPMIFRNISKAERSAEKSLQNRKLKTFLRLPAYKDAEVATKKAIVVSGPGEVQRIFLLKFPFYPLDTFYRAP
jgi:hypothetical protein